MAYAPDLHNVTRENLFYTLVMFPYPSGYGLHVGHASNFVINDVLARYKRLRGYTVFNPFGFDSFGLPTENYAMKLGKPAYEVTKENIAYFKSQTAALNLSFDSEREVVTSSPEYYKRTQWLFQQLYKAGLVYRDTLWVNRCPECQTVLANDQVIDGACERCKSEIIQKKHPQWFIKITDYADKLINDLDLVDRPEETKIGQRNWIGRSEGAEIDFRVVQKIQNFQKDQKGNNGEEYDEKTKVILGIGIEIHKKYKDTITEKQFRDIFVEKLRKEGFLIEKEKPVRIEEEGVFIGNRYIDIVVDNEILLELKKSPLQKETDKGIRQLRNYLDLQGKGCGLFLNISSETLQIKRLNYYNKDHNLNTSEHSESSEIITVFTTRPDTVYGVTALVLAPENTLLDSLLSGEKKTEVEEYRQITLAKTAVQRQKDLKEKSGVFSGLYAKHPLTGEDVAIWYADYVLADYGTGAVMMVPAHDERDWEFAKKFGIECRVVIAVDGEGMEKWIKEGVITTIPELNGDYSIVGSVFHSNKTYYYLLDKCFIGIGKLINSDQFNGLDSLEAKKAITDHFEAIGVGRKKVSYKLRDWSVNRQRYWGSPIPVYYDEHNEPHLIPEEELPVLLPLDLENYKPTGKSPLEDHPTFPVYRPKQQKKIVNVDMIDEIINTVHLPLLIHGKEKTGASFFTVQFVTALAKQGKKIVFFSKYEQAKELLVESINHEGYTYIDNSIESIEGNNNLLIWNNDDLHLFTEFLHKNICQEYIIVIKNCDSFDAKEMIQYCMGNNIIISGDANTIDFGGYIDFSTIIAFSDYNTLMIGDIGKYNGLFQYNTEKTYHRECDTLDTFMCSSFYFLRYPDANNEKEFCDPQLLNKCFPIDFYIGGKEHTVGHLLYARFIHKFLYDQGYVSSPEPFQRLVHQGMVLGADGRKMSKRRGNIIDPMEVIEKYGADAVRTYLMFMGPVEQEKVWNDGALAGVQKFLGRIIALGKKGVAVSDQQNDAVERALHKAIKGLTDDMEALKYNTAVSKLMILLNSIEEQKTITKAQLCTFMLLLFPFAPETARTIWEGCGKTDDIEYSPWPTFDPALLVEETISLPVQINGKVRANILVAPDADEATVLDVAQQDEQIQKYLTGGTIKKVIYVSGRILNIVV